MSKKNTYSPEHYDVLVLGAGVSGIGAAYYLQENTSKTFKILERRNTFGGTWDLFKYPGIRTDSDMYSFSFSFHPWTRPKHFASGGEILAYLKEVIDTYNLEKYISYGHYVKKASYSSKTRKWTLRTAERKIFTCNFLWECCGYYNYDEGYLPKFKGFNSFKGPIIHPQKWPQDLDYTNKDIVVIGSGATAITLIPELAKKCSHVTMLQRSPGYIIAVPDSQPLSWISRFAIKIFGKWMRRLIFKMIKFWAVYKQMVFYLLCKRFPAFFKRFWLKQVKKHYPNDMEHFTPRYNLWDQRLCAAPDGDFFRAYNTEKVSIVTAHIDKFTEKGIQLRSPEAKELCTDIIVTATGLNMVFAGGIDFFLDGVRCDMSNEFGYKGFMLSNVPNFFLSVGYINASWTLRVDLTASLVSEVLNHMDKHGYSQLCPQAEEGKKINPSPFLDLTSGYVKRSKHLMPKIGDRYPWRMIPNYFVDYIDMRIKSFESDRALRFT